MWPFKADQTKKPDLASQGAFSRASVKKLLSGGTDAAAPRFQNGTIDYLLFQVMDEGLDTVVDRLGIGIEIVDSGGGVCVTTIPPILVATFGFPFEVNMGIGSRRKAADTLMKRLGDSVKIVHGRELGLFGMLGGENSRWCLTPVLPSFELVFQELSRLKFGECLERTGSQ